LLVAGVVGVLLVLVLRLVLVVLVLHLHFLALGYFMRVAVVVGAVVRLLVVLVVVLPQQLGHLQLRALMALVAVLAA
jgi:hypothetical protein